MTAVAGLSWSRRSEGQDPSIPSAAAFHQSWGFGLHAAEGAENPPPRWSQTFIGIELRSRRLVASCWSFVEGLTGVYDPVLVSAA